MCTNVPSNTPAEQHDVEPDQQHDVELNEGAVEAFTMGFLDGLRHRSELPPELPSELPPEVEQ